MVRIKTCYLVNIVLHKSQLFGGGVSASSVSVIRVV